MEKNKMNIDYKTTEELMDKINKEEEKYFTDFLNKIGYTFSDVYNKNINIEIVYQKMNKYYIVFNETNDIILGGVGIIFDNDCVTQNDDAFTISYTIKTLTPEEIDLMNVKDYLAEEKNTSLYHLKKCKDILSLTPQDVFEEHCKKCGLNDVDKEPDSKYEDENFKLILPTSSSEHEPVDYEKLFSEEFLKEVDDLIENRRKRDKEISVIPFPEDYDCDIIVVPKKHTKHIAWMIQMMINTKEIYPELKFIPYAPIPVADINERTCFQNRYGNISKKLDNGK